MHVWLISHLLYGYHEEERWSRVVQSPSSLSSSVVAHGKACFRAKWPCRPTPISGICSMERLGAFQLPPPLPPPPSWWVASPLQGLQVCSQKTRKSVIYLTGEKLRDKKIATSPLGLTFEAVKGLVIWRNFAFQKWCNSVNKLEPCEIQKRHCRRLSPKKLYCSPRPMPIWLYSSLGLISGTVCFASVCVFDCESYRVLIAVHWSYFLYLPFFFCSLLA